MFKKLNIFIFQNDLYFNPVVIRHTLRNTSMKLKTDYFNKHAHYIIVTE